MSVGYQLIKLNTNEVIFEEGTPSNNAYLIKSGTVEITKFVNGNRRVLAKLKAPAIFGEMALFLKDQRRTASAIATSPCELVIVGKESYVSLVESSPKILKSTIEVLVNRLRTCSDNVARMPNYELSIIQTLSLLNAHQVKSIDFTAFLKDMSVILMRDQKDITEVVQVLIDAAILGKRISSSHGTELFFMQKQDFLFKAKQAINKSIEEEAESAE